MLQSLDLSLTELAPRLAIAGLVGLAVGIEREWSAPTEKAERPFAGLRTFFLLGLLGGTAGILMAAGQIAAATVLFAGSAGLVIIAYAMKLRRADTPLDGTTEVAALVVLALALLAGLGYLMIAAGTVALVALALGEKTRLHNWVRKIDAVELRAGLHFLVLALVVLPLLPTGPYPALWGFQPRALWTIVLLLSGLSFAGYIARQIVGPERGYGVTGILGGAISSTAVTLQFSRLSRAHPKQGDALALGVVGACTVLPFRIFVISSALDIGVGKALVPYLLPVFLVGALLVTIGMRRAPASETALPLDKSPLGLRSALVMAVAFQLSIFLLEFTRDQWGSGGLIGTAVLLGLTDMDALTVSMTRMNAGDGLAATAALGIAIGIASNTIFKLALATVIGTGSFRKYTVLGLLLLLATLALTIFWNWPN
jgi:uncharacterized membrane protein (DUF4010 family)